MKKAMFVFALALILGANAGEDVLALLQAMYRRDMSNETGRVRWHGPIVHQDIRTNELIKVSVYEDGYLFTNSFSILPRRKIDPEILKKLQKRRFGSPLREFKLNPGDVQTNSMSPIQMKGS